MPGLRKRYKASTLIEVLVAMVIILICAGLGMTAFSNLGRDINGNMEIRADIYLTRVINNTKIDNDYTDKIFEFEGMHIKRRVFPYKKEKRLRILQMEAYSDTNRKIWEIKELILITP